MMTEIALFTYHHDNMTEVVVYHDNGKAKSYWGETSAQALSRAPKDIRNTFHDSMKLYKTRTGTRVSGEWYRQDGH